MTEKEAIKALEVYILQLEHSLAEEECEEYSKEERGEAKRKDEQTLGALNMAIKALEEIQKYRAIGAVGNCKNAMQKQRIVKPEFLRMLNDTRYRAKCKCGRVITADIDFRDNPKFCSECGTEFEWSDEE